MTDRSGAIDPTGDGPVLAPDRIGACAVASRNYLSFVRVLAESWLEHHPGSTVTIVLIDADEASVEWRPDGVEIIGAAALDIAPDEIRRMTAMYSAVEYATALKPWVLQYVLRRADVAVYFDGDIEILASMGDVAARALEGVVITPHNLHPLPPDGRLPDHPTILLAGIYNAGFLAVSANDGGFCDWWSEQLSRSCISDVQQGFHTDQRWLDFVPSYFPHVILRDPTCNVAYWNLHERPVEWAGDRMVLDGRPVRFFHYSGLSADTGWQLSRFLGPDPRITLADDPAVARACRRWIRRLDDAGRAADRTIPYGFATTANGLVLDVHARRTYRDALIAAEAGDGPEPPNPLDDDGGEAFEAWLLDRPAGRRLSRYARHIWDLSPPMQAVFPDVEGDHAASWRAWLAAHGAEAAGIPPGTLARLDHDHAPDPFPDVDQEHQVSDEHDRPVPAGETVAGRSVAPVPDIDEAWHLLQKPFADGTDSRLGPPARAAYRVANRLQSQRDARTIDVSLKLVSAADELRERIAAIGPLLARVVDHELPAHGVRLSILDESAVGIDKAQAQLAADVDRRLDDLGRRLDQEVGRIDGALEQDTITANVLSDAERRLHGEIAELRRRLDELEALRGGALDEGR